MKNDDYDYYEPTVRVMLPCTEQWADESEVEFMGVQSDVSGRDLLTYRCPSCDEVHESYRVLS